MQGIIFEGTSEERGQPTAAQGLNLPGDADLSRLASGDVLWVVTRLADDRGTPALCGRLVVDRVESYTSESAGYREDRSDRTHRLVVDAERSERCAPFTCEAVAAWEIWRKPFGGVAFLSDEQGTTLAAAWSEAARDTK